PADASSRGSRRSISTSAGPTTDPRSARTPPRRRGTPAPTGRTTGTSPSPSPSGRHGARPSPPRREPECSSGSSETRKGGPGIRRDPPSSFHQTIHFKVPGCSLINHSLRLEAQPALEPVHHISRGRHILHGHPLEPPLGWAPPLSRLT